MQHKKGFTLIELLVVIAIIGLLSTLAVVALNSARQKARDAKRVSDVLQMQAVLERYFYDVNLYPVRAEAAGDLKLGGAGARSLSSTNGWSDTLAGTTYMGDVPTAPMPPSGNAYAYVPTDGASYGIEFALEGATGSLPAGMACATPDGFAAGACPDLIP